MPSCMPHRPRPSVTRPTGAEYDANTPGLSLFTEERPNNRIDHVRRSEQTRAESRANRDRESPTDKRQARLETKSIDGPHDTSTNAGTGNQPDRRTAHAAILHETGTRVTPAIQTRNGQTSRGKLDGPTQRANATGIRNRRPRKQPLRPPTPMPVPSDIRSDAETWHPSPAAAPLPRLSRQADRSTRRQIGKTADRSVADPGRFGLRHRSPALDHPM